MAIQDVDLGDCRLVTIFDALDEGQDPQMACVVPADASGVERWSPSLLPWL